MRGFSIIICCYNSADRLPITVKYISKLQRVDGVECELIIVDNNSSDNTTAVAKKLADTYGDLSIIIDQEPQTGKVYALERGIELSNYDYIIICDDDNLLHHNYLVQALKILDTDSGVGVIGGKSFLNNTSNLPQWFTQLQNAYAVGEQWYSSGDITETKGYVWGAGMVLRKAAWIQVQSNGFDVFSTGRKTSKVSMTGEDTEMCLLIQSQGYKIYYSDKLELIHNLEAHRISWNHCLRLFEGFARSQVYFNIYSKTIGKGEIQFYSFWLSEIKENLVEFLRGWRFINFYKILYIAFAINREGYLPGLEESSFIA